MRKKVYFNQTKWNEWLSTNFVDILDFVNKAGISYARFITLLNNSHQSCLSKTVHRLFDEIQKIDKNAKMRNFFEVRVR